MRPKAIVTQNDPFTPTMVTAHALLRPRPEVQRFR